MKFGVFMAPLHHRCTTPSWSPTAWVSSTIRALLRAEARLHLAS
jgi:hypothetical protein